MEINRRQFIKASASLVLLGSNAVFANFTRENLLSCRTNQDGEHFFSMLDGNGSLALDIKLPARGHGISLMEKKQLVAVFARRPGDFVWIVDLLTKQVVEKVSAAKGRHFYGHGLFVEDGARLLCSENAYETGEGVIGVYDADNNFARIGEFKSHGVGPHDVNILSDGETLVVANGGIRTHPDLPRIKSNLATMRPNLAYISSESGRLLHKHEPEGEWHQLSIRHIDISADDKVAIAMQFQGKPYMQPPLVAVQADDQAIKFLMAPEHIQSRLHNYCGSVAFNDEGKEFVVTSPRGGMVTYWSAEGAYLGAHEQLDACGVSRMLSQSRAFYVSDGTGSIMRASLNSASERMPKNPFENAPVTSLATSPDSIQVASLEKSYSLGATKWDNHMVSYAG